MDTIKCIFFFGAYILIFYSFTGNEKASDFLNSQESDNQSSKENNEMTGANKETNEGNSSEGLTKQDSLNSKKIDNSAGVVNQSSKINNEKEKDENKETKEGSSSQAQTERIQSLITKHDTLNLQKIYKCFACQKQFTLSYYLKLHVRSHTGKCGELPFKFSSFTILVGFNAQY